MFVWISWFMFFILVIMLVFLNVLIVNVGFMPYLAKLIKPNNFVEVFKNYSVASLMNVCKVYNKAQIARFALEQAIFMGLKSLRLVIITYHILCVLFVLI